MLGKEHSDTLTSVYCLAYLLYQNKRYKDAEIFYHRAYAGYRKALGEKYPTTAACSRYYSNKSLLFYRVKRMAISLPIILLLPSTASSPTQPQHRYIEVPQDLRYIIERNQPAKKNS